MLSVVMLSVVMLYVVAQYHYIATGQKGLPDTNTLAYQSSSPLTKTVFAAGRLFQISLKFVSYSEVYPSEAPFWCSILG